VSKECDLVSCPPHDFLRALSLAKFFTIARATVTWYEAVSTYDRLTDLAPGCSKVDDAIYPG